MQGMPWKTAVACAVLLVAGASIAKSPKTPPIRLTARALLEAFEGNSVAADAKYKGRQVTVTDGIVARVAPTDEGGAVVLLAPGPGSPLSTAVNCVMGPKQRRKADTLSQLDVVTLKGKCLGLMVVDGARFVNLWECSLQSE